MQFGILLLQFSILPLQFGILPLQFGILPRSLIKVSPRTTKQNLDPRCTYVQTRVTTTTKQNLDPRCTYVHAGKNRKITSFENSEVGSLKTIVAATLHGFGNVYYFNF
jgi:hypothetical protein